MMCSGLGLDTYEEGRDREDIYNWVKAKNPTQSAYRILRISFHAGPQTQGVLYAEEKDCPLFNTVKQVTDSIALALVKEQSLVKVEKENLMGSEI